MSDNFPVYHKVKSHIPLTPYSLPSQPVEWHTNDILSLKVSPDGELLASAGLDGQVIVSDVASKRLLLRFQLSEITHPTCLAWASPFQGSKRLAVGYQDGTICILSLDTNIPCNRFALFENRPPVVEICFDLAKNRLLIAYETLCCVITFKDDDGDISDGFGVFEFRAEVGGMALLGSGYLLVSVPMEKKVSLFSVCDVALTPSEEFEVDYQPHYIAASDLSHCFCVGGTDGSLHIYEWEPGVDLQEIAVLSYPRVFVEPRPISFSFFHGSHFLLIGSEEDEALIFDTVSKREIAVLKHQKGCYIRAVAAWANMAQVFVYTGSSHARTYIAIWECSLSSLLLPNVELGGAIMPQSEPRLELGWFETASMFGLVMYLILSVWLSVELAVHIYLGASFVFVPPLESQLVAMVRRVRLPSATLSMMGFLGEYFHKLFNFPMIFSHL